MRANTKVMASGFAGTFKDDVWFVGAFGPLIVFWGSRGEAMVAMSSPYRAACSPVLLVDEKDAV
jgi:hypothetical protein